jgi:hypothetical protein
LIILVPSISVGQTPGIRIGSGLFRPTLSLGGTFDDNVGRSSNDKISDFILFFSPGILLAFPTDAIAFALSGSATYNRYMGMTEKDSTSLSNLGAVAGLDLTLNPHGFFSFTVNEAFNRSDDPSKNTFNERTGVFYNKAGALADFKPGGGALSFQFGYSLALTYFSADTMDFMNSYEHGAGFQFKWLFFPRTAFLINADATFPQYVDKFDFVGSEAENPTIRLLKATAGVTGQFTSHMQLTVKAGYGDTFSGDRADNHNFQSGIAEAQFTYFFTPTTAFDFGYLRGVQPVPIYGFIGIDRPYAGFGMIIADRYKFGLRFSVDLENYGRVPSSLMMPDEEEWAQGQGFNNVEEARLDPTYIAPAGFTTADRDDLVIKGYLPVDIAILRWLFTGISYKIERRDSNENYYDYLSNEVKIYVKAEY